MVGEVLILRTPTCTSNAVFGVSFFGTARGTVNLGKKLHLKVRRTEGEPQLSLFFKLV